MKKSALALPLALSLMTGAAHAGGGPVCVVVDPIWTAGHTSAQTTLNGAVNTMVSQFAAQSTVTTNMIVSAIKVLTTQDSFEGQAESVAVNRTLQGVGDAYVEQRAAEEVIEAFNTYGPPGQAVGSCEVVADIAILNSAIESVETRASQIVMNGGIDARPGSTVTHDQALQKRSAVAAADYDLVTSSQAMFDPNTSAAIKDTYMNNLIGVPMEKPAAFVSVADNIQFMTARRAEALRSPATVSLAAVRASSERAGHFHTAGMAGVQTRSLQEGIDWIVDRFGGGSEYEEWAASLATKSEVGLMKEITRLYSIRLGLVNKMTQSADRRQVVLGSLIATEVAE